MANHRPLNLGRGNAIAMICVLPVLVRLWIEAVVWRLERGPQMLGFSLAHGAAGWFTPLLLVSALLAFVYFWLGGLVVVAHVLPAVRKRTRGVLYVGVGVIALPAFSFLADALQSPEAPAVVVIGGGVLLAVLVAGLGWAAFAGWRGGRGGAI